MSDEWGDAEREKWWRAHIEENYGNLMPTHRVRLVIEADLEVFAVPWVDDQESLQSAMAEAWSSAMSQMLDEVVPAESRMDDWLLMLDVEVTKVTNEWKEDHGVPGQGEPSTPQPEAGDESNDTPVAEQGGEGGG